MYLLKESLPICVWAVVSTHVPQHTCGGKRTTFRSCFMLLTLLRQDVSCFCHAEYSKLVDLGASDLHLASSHNVWIFTCWATSLFLIYHFAVLCVYVCMCVVCVCVCVGVYTSVGGCLYECAFGSQKLLSSKVSHWRFVHECSRLAGQRVPGLCLSPSLNSTEVTKVHYGALLSPWW